MLAFGVWKAFFPAAPATPDPTPTPASIVIVTSATSTSTSTSASTVPTPTPKPVSTSSGTISTQAAAQTTATSGTSGGNQRLQEAFGFVSPANCMFSTPELGTDAVAQCADQNAVATYREYTDPASSSRQMQSYQTRFQARSSNWAYANDPSETPQGKVLQFIDENNHAVIYWTLDSKHMSGTAVANDSDQPSLFNWWKTVAIQPPHA